MEVTKLTDDILGQKVEFLFKDHRDVGVFVRKGSNIYLLSDYYPAGGAGGPDSRVTTQLEIYGYKYSWAIDNTWTPNTGSYNVREVRLINTEKYELWT